MKLANFPYFFFLPFFCYAKAEVFVDIECDPKHLEKVIRLLKREVRSVNYASAQVSDEFPPPTPLSACSSFGKWIFFLIIFIFMKQYPSLFWISHFFSSITIHRSVDSLIPFFSIDSFVLFILFRLR